MRLAAQAKGGFYPTPDTVAEMLGSTFYLTSGKTGKKLTANYHILDPCCGEGTALADVIAPAATRIAKYQGHNVLTYGVETNKDRAEVAATKLDRVLHASIFNTSIANNSFQMLYLNPPYDSEAGQDRVEIQFLEHCTRYLMSYGVLVYIVPRHIISRAAHFISTHYNQIKVIAFPKGEVERFDQVVLMAVKKSYAMHNPDDYNHLLSPTQPLENMNGDNLRRWFYQLYPEPTEKLLFTQRSFDPEVTAAEAREKGIWANAEFNLKMWPPEIQHTRPLMPLRQGHLAMLIAAGFLNNMEIQTDEGPILVKGRATKKLKVAKEDEKTLTEREQLTTKVTTLNLATGAFTELQPE